MKYFVSYKYQRAQIELQDNGDKVEKRWESYSNDEIEIDFDIKTMKDVRRAEQELFDLLKKECQIRNQQLIALLILGWNKLDE